MRDRWYFLLGALLLIFLAGYLTSTLFLSSPTAVPQQIVVQVAPELQSPMATSQTESVSSSEQRKSELAKEKEVQKQRTLVFYQQVLNTYDEVEEEIRQDRNDGIRKSSLRTLLLAKENNLASAENYIDMQRYDKAHYFLVKAKDDALAVLDSYREPNENIYFSK